MVINFRDTPESTMPSRNWFLTKLPKRAARKSERLIGKSNIFLFLIIFTVILIHTQVHKSLVRYIVKDKLANLGKKLNPVQHLPRIEVQAKQEWSPTAQISEIIRHSVVNDSHKNIDPPKTRVFNTDHCPKLEYDWTSGPITPRFKMNEEKYLIPLLYNGPNNQMLGFQQSVALAIILNRTLILPNFYQHEYQPSALRTIIKAERRLDIDLIRKMVSVVPMENAGELCRHNIDVILNANPLSSASLQADLPRFFIESKLKSVNFLSNIHEKEVVDELKRQLAGRGTPWTALMKTKWLSSSYLASPDSSNIEEIKKALNSDERCALYFHPFRQMHLELADEEDIPADFHTHEEASVLNGYIYANLQPPPHLNRLNEGFIEDVLNSKSSGFMAVHWRYDVEDFFNYLCRDHLLAKRKKLCDNVDIAIKNSSALAVAISHKLHELQNTEHPGIKSVYLAAPPTMDQFVRATSEAFTRLVKGKSKIYSLNDLKSYAQNFYRGCDGSENLAEDEDALSIVEMEICSSSAVFVRSQQSTWTQHVQFNRYFLRKIPKSKDPVVLDLISNVAQGGL